MKFLPLLLLLLISPTEVSWGFLAHKRINRMAVFSLPPALFGFYKTNIDFITEQAVVPDKRRYAVKEEGIRHYIDLDYYTSPPPQNFSDAIEMYTKDTLEKYGILPYNLILVKNSLTKAFREKDINRILRLSADAGHYIGDAHVPLHATMNYNGQLTGQEGIHGLWESRLPELFAEEYSTYFKKARYIKDFNSYIWQVVYETSQKVDTVLYLEKKVSESLAADKKFAFEERGKTTSKTYNREFCNRYHSSLNGMVEKQMNKAIVATASFWYTCWIDAGQPELNLKKAEILTTESEKGEECDGR
jgi:hypothetical protein